MNIKKISLLLLVVVLAIAGGLFARYLFGGGNQTLPSFLAQSCDAEFKDFEISTPFGFLKMKTPAFWSKQKQDIAFSGVISKFDFIGDPRGDSDKLEAALSLFTSKEFKDDPFDPDGALAIIDSLNKAYDQRSLAGIDEEFLVLPIGPVAQIVQPKSFEYIESSDGFWRGYVYLTLFVTQDADRHEPHTRFVLINKKLPDVPVLVGRVDLETLERVFLDERLNKYFAEQAMKDQGGVQYALIAEDIDVANQKIRSGIVSKEFSCQFDNMRSFIKSIKSN